MTMAAAAAAAATTAAATTTTTTNNPTPGYVVCRRHRDAAPEVRRSNGGQSDREAQWISWDYILPGR